MRSIFPPLPLLFNKSWKDLLTGNVSQRSDCWILQFMVTTLICWKSCSANHTVPFLLRTKHLLASFLGELVQNKYFKWIIVSAPNFKKPVLIGSFCLDFHEKVFVILLPLPISFADGMNNWNLEEVWNYPWRYPDPQFETRDLVNKNEMSLQWPNVAFWEYTGTKPPGVWRGG